MPDPWTAAVKKSRQLTVFAAPGFMTNPGPWGAVLFKKIIDEFNHLSRKNKLGVSLIQSKIVPDSQGNGGANVQIEISQGKHSFTANGEKFERSLPPSLTSGITHPVHQDGEIIRAFIFVPSNPQISAPSGPRGAGSGVKIGIALHECLHACGLTEADPGHEPPQKESDLFMSFPQFDPNSPPDGHPGDRIRLGPSKFMPPFFLNTRTAELVRKNWQ